MKLKSITFFLRTFLCPIFICGQLELNLRHLQKEDTYGVFVRIKDGYTPSNKIVTGTGQITILVPKGNQLTKLINFNGSWTIYDLVSSPIENPEFDYYSIGFVLEPNSIHYRANGRELLLFTIKIADRDIDRVKLIDNHQDVFAQLPNSKNTSPSNELSAIDPLDNYRIYKYVGLFT